MDLLLFSNQPEHELVRQTLEELRRLPGYGDSRTGCATVKFHNDAEPFAEILESVHGRQCIVIACDASDGRRSVNDYTRLTRMLLGALDYAEADIKALIFPYFAYGRQDRHRGETTERTANGAKMYAEDLERTAKIRFIGIMEPHTVYIVEMFTRRCRRLPVVQEFIPYLRQYLGRVEETVFCSPDVGGMQRTRRLAHLAGATLPCVVMDKERERVGEVARVAKVSGDVYERDVVIVDDIIDTAGTLCSSVRIAKAEGARKACVCAVHGLFNKDAVTRIRDCGVDRVFITSSVTQKSEVRECGFIQIIPLGGLMADVIQCAMTKGSWSALRKTRLEKAR